MTSGTYDDGLNTLTNYYNGDASRRDRGEKSDWKVEERARFLDALRDEGKRTLLEVGAGTGQDSLFFRQAGLTVTATDLSPVMVEHCRAKGLEAHVMDFLGLEFDDASFDAIYSLNCLLHVPRETLPEVLLNLQRLLAPGGLFYLGVYGGVDETATKTSEFGERTFVLWADEPLVEIVSESFHIEYFRHIDFDGEWPPGFQSMILRRR